MKIFFLIKFDSSFSFESVVKWPYLPVGIVSLFVTLLVYINRFMLWGRILANIDSGLYLLFSFYLKRRTWSSYLTNVNGSIGGEINIIWGADGVILRH